MLHKLSFSLLVFLVSFVAMTSGQDVKDRTGADKLTQYQIDSIAAAQPIQVNNGIVDYSNPDSFVAQGALGALYAAVMAILAYLGGFLPGVRKIKDNYVRSGAIIFALLASLATFKYGALTPKFFETVMSAILPNLVLSNGVFDAINWILKRFGITLPKPSPAKSESNG